MAAPYLSVAQVVVRGKLHGQVTNNVWNFGSNVSPAPSLNTLLAAIVDCITTTLKQAVASDWSFEQAGARYLYPVLTDEQIILPGTVQTGFRNAGVPGFCAYLINLKTGLGGRTHRGKIFIAGVAEQDSANGLADPAVLLLLAQFCLCMAGHFIPSEGNTPEFEFGVLSRKESKLPGRNLGNSIKPITQMLPNPIIAVHHSRKIGVGS